MQNLKLGKWECLESSFNISFTTRHTLISQDSTPKRIIEEDFTGKEKKIFFYFFHPNSCHQQNSLFHLFLKKHWKKGENENNEKLWIEKWECLESSFNISFKVKVLRDVEIQLQKEFLRKISNRARK